MSKLNKYFRHPQAVAVELFSAGWCNLNCTYCYIPKHDFLKGIHSEIIEKIKSGRMMQELKEAYGEDLEAIAHWGTEPTLTVKLFRDFYEEAFKVFPKFKKIMLSSNFMTNPDNIVTFIANLPQTRKLHIEIQVSIDGPPWITDKNRVLGSTYKIIDNVLRVTGELAKLETVHEIAYHLKPTITDVDIAELTEYLRMKEYYDFFEDFMGRWLSMGKDKIQISKCCDPTLAVPGDYKKKDGMNFYGVVLNQVELKGRPWKYITIPESNYYQRLLGKLPYMREYFTKHRMFICSAGDSQFGLGEKENSIHSCHRTFYLDNPRYKEAVEKWPLDTLTMEGIKQGRSDVLRDGNIANTDNELELVRMLFRTRTSNDFARHKFSTITAQVMELARCGLVSECYNRVEWAQIFALFSSTVDCPMDSIANAATPFAFSTSLIKVFCNGHLENIVGRLRHIID